jgi:carbon storage regulator
MLVLSRKKGEAINIAEDVTITVREISGSRVVLGFEAPGDVRIVRQELPLRAAKQSSPGATHCKLAAPSAARVRA